MEFNELLLIAETFANRNARKGSLEYDSLVCGFIAGYEDSQKKLVAKISIIKGLNEFIYKKIFLN